MYQITITQEAENQLRSLTAREQRIVEAGVMSRLPHDPTTPTRAIKRLRPNPFAEYELRVGDFRVLYNVEGSEVVLLVVGRKSGNKSIVEGDEFDAHQDNSAEQSGSESEDDAE